MADSFGKPLGEHAVSYEPVKLSDYRDKLLERMPAVRIYDRPTFGDVLLGADFRINVNFSVYASEEDALAYLDAAIERLQQEAIWGLGLQPKIRAMEDQVQAYRASNEGLKADIARKDALIASQQEEIERLAYEDDDEGFVEGELNG